MMPPPSDAVRDVARGGGQRPRRPVTSRLRRAAVACLLTLLSLGGAQVGCNSDYVLICVEGHDEDEDGWYWQDWEGGLRGGRSTCPEGWVATGTVADFDDTSPKIFPGQDERCLNGIDDDCDGAIDEDCLVESMGS